MDMDFSDEEFSASDSDSENEVYIPPDKLELDSDDSEFEAELQKARGETPDSKPERGERGPKKVDITHKMIMKWEDSLKTHGSLKAFEEVVSAFRSAAALVVGEKQESGTDGPASKYRARGGTVFNAVVRLCLTHIPGVLGRHLKLEVKEKEGEKPELKFNKDKWSRLKPVLKAYFTQLLQLVVAAKNSDVTDTLLKHVHVLASHMTLLPGLASAASKSLVKIWSTFEAESSRVLAFLSLVRLSRLSPYDLLPRIAKRMYKAMVSNSAFVSPTTLPQISFLQRCAVELFALDKGLAYRLAFVYIRQLAIHINTATENRNKDNVQRVYNWQHVQCLKFMVRLLTALAADPAASSLVYPLVQVIMGTLRLVPTARFYPLRFHCVRLLHELSEASNVFVPTLPLLTEVLQQTDLNKRHKSSSAKPFNFDVILKFTKSQMSEKAFKDGLVAQVTELLLASLSLSADRADYPEISLVPLKHLRRWCKECKAGNYSRQITQVVRKGEETASDVRGLRRAMSCTVSPDTPLKVFTTTEEKENLPVRVFLKQWTKSHKQMQPSLKDQLDDVSIPRMERPNRELERGGGAGLIDTGDSDDDDDERILFKGDGEDDSDASSVLGEDASDVEMDGETDDDEDDADDEEEERSSEKEKRPAPKPRLTGEEKRKIETAKSRRSLQTTAADTLTDFRLEDFDQDSD